MAEDPVEKRDEKAERAEREERRSGILDIVAAIALGITTGLAAFGAYQSSLYGGNQATAYTEATNTLGEANRELLRGVQERAFDTTVWVENLKAQSMAESAAVQPAAGSADAGSADAGSADAGSADAPAAAADDEADADGPEPTPEEYAQALAAELTTGVGDDSLPKKLSKLQATRRDLTAALKWADEEHAKRMKAMTNDQKLVLARQLVDFASQQEAVTEKTAELLVRLNLAESTDEEIEAAFEADPAAKAERTKLETEYASFDDKQEKVLDKLSKPMFFESPAYTASQEQAYKDLVTKGKKTFDEGQQANEIGDKFTLATVFMTVGLFFLGLAPIMRRYPMKATFLLMGLAVAVGSTAFMFMHPLA